MENLIDYGQDNESLPFSGDDAKEKEKGICDCPICKEAGRNGRIYEGKKSFYCSTAVKTGECDFILYKNNIEKLARREITSDEVKQLCSEGQFSATCTKIRKENETYTGIFSLQKAERYYTLELNFPD